MKRLCGVMLCLVMWSGLAFAGPFGLSMGMSLEEVEEACGGRRPRRIGDDRYMIEPAKRHSMLKRYAVWIDDEHGLYYIRAASHDIATSGYGTKIQSAFSSLESSLAKSYGKPTDRIDEIDPSSIWKDERYWMMALSAGARRLASVWQNGDLPDGLVGVALWAHAEDGSKGYILLEYAFENAALVKSAEDDVL